MTDYVKLFDYQINYDSCSVCVAKALDSIKTKSQSTYMACANPHSLVVAKNDAVFQKALHAADILLPDGTGIILAAKILGLPMTKKVAGTDIFLEMNSQAQKQGGLKYFFLGSSDTVLGLIKEKLNREYPEIEVCGVYSPPFKDQFTLEDNRKMVDAIRSSNPDVLWVGMTAPKQEKWIYQNIHRLNVPFTGAIGAVFDFYAGTKKRSSDIWIRLGLEWLPRFLQEPRRLWERNLKSTPIFLFWVLREKIRMISK